jgi:hypothetical protein
MQFKGELETLYSVQPMGLCSEVSTWNIRVQVNTFTRALSFYRRLYFPKLTRIKLATRINSTCPCCSVRSLVL